MTVLPPAPRPCGSCPYRRDHPSGMWAREEYERLVAYDSETALQPLGAFMCHQQDGRLCAGWVAVHDMEESLGFRILSLTLDIDVVEAILDYETDVPLFGSGAEAATHGIAEVDAPGERAARMGRDLRAKRRRRR